MSNKNIPKLNKSFIHGLLMAGSFLIIPAIVSLISSNEEKKIFSQIENKAHANHNNADVFAISGVDKFPEHYGMVKDFEAKIALEKEQDENFLEALDVLENNKEVDTEAHWAGDRDNQPWDEAKKREEKQKAFDHYDASRSPILFFEATKNQKSTTQEGSSEDAILKMMERSLAVAEPNPKDIFFMKREPPRDTHKDFLLGGKGNAGHVKEVMPFMVSEGTLINAILLSEINTDLPGPILARVSHNIWDSKTGKTLLIPQNSKLIGEYNSSIGNGQNRAQIVWTRIIYPNQQSIDLGRMVGVDRKGVSGSAGHVDNHYDKVAMGLLMTTALSASVRMTQGKYEPNTASFSQEVGNTLTQETARLGNKISDQMLSIKPTIKVPMGERLNVFVQQDLSLRPYDG